MSTWFIIAQIFGIITIGFEFASYQIKDKQKYLLVNGIGSALWAVMFVAIGMATSMSTQVSLIIVAVYSSTRALVFFWIFRKDSKRRRMAGKIFLGFMILVALSAGIYVIVGLPTREVQILQSVALVFALGFVIGQYMPGKHPVRITVFFYAILLLLTQTPLNILYAEPPLNFRWNPMGMLIELAKMSSVLVFYFMFFNKKLIAKRLVKLKAIINCEMNKITSDTEISVLADAGVMKLGDLEKLVAKMIRMEIKAIDTSEITNVTSTESNTQAVLADLKTVHDLKMILEKVIRLKMQKLDKPKMASLAQDAILAKS
ncbi:MAG: YgjV family protein [Firmicutes bacterium]|nr:YgjV family protein [Bacillota bacterium]